MLADCQKIGTVAKHKMDPIQKTAGIQFSAKSTIKEKFMFIYSDKNMIFDTPEKILLPKGVLEEILFDW